MSELGGRSSPPEPSREGAAEAVAALGFSRRPKAGAPRAFYFGTYERPGHYLRDQSWKSIWPEHPHEGPDKIQWGPLPWRNIDGGLLARKRPLRQGEAALHHKDGWTALAFPNYMDDDRGGSNSAFFFEATLDFEQAVAAARAIFPHVMERIDQAFEVVPAFTDDEAVAP